MPISKFFVFFRPILMQFLQSVHLNGLLMSHKNIAVLFRKGVQIPKFRIFERYIEFLFSSNFDGFLVEWIVLSSFGSLSLV